MMIIISIFIVNAAADEYFKGNSTLINNLLMSLAEEQIKASFIQSKKEVNDLHTRISQGLRKSKNNGKTFGMPKGAKIKTKKELACVEVIRKHSKDFVGSLDDLDVIKLCGCSSQSYYKYKRKLKKYRCIQPIIFLFIIL